MVISGAGFSSPPDEVSRLDTLRQDAVHFLETGADIFSAPMRFESRDWGWVAAWMGGTLVLSTQDLRVKRFVLAHQSRTADALFAFDDYYGSKYTPIYLMGTYAAGLLFDLPRMRRTALYASEALFYVGVISAIIKVGVGRQRPYGGDDPYVFRPFNGTIRYRSFPSGHTVIAFATSTVIAEQIHHSLWKWGWYGAAALVAAARIYHNVHWLSDVVPSAVLGYVIARRVMTRERSDTPPRVRLTPIWNPTLSSVGMGLRIRF
ncbi:MAG: phosphatase PAP2 family protein [Calditrichaeota bacterium]|nr:phosphatase PAP2 family protein [Calditrichota bacterium]